MKSPAIIQLLDGISASMFGITRSEAHKQLICVSCKKPIQLIQANWTEHDSKEYSTSALCPDCFPKG